jgi:hypothetical protein
MKKIFFRFFPVLFFSAASLIVCSSFKLSDSRRVVINHEYSLEIPNGFEENKTLNDDASLQYADLNDDMYVIVIDEDKTDFVKAYKGINDYNPGTTVEQNYRRVQIASMQKKIKKASKPDIYNSKIDGYDAEIVNFTGNVKGIKPKIFYKTGFLVTDDKCYMIMTWTLADYRLTNDDVLDRIINSFKLEN